MINFSRYIEHLRFKYNPRIASLLINLSTYRAQCYLKANVPIGILVDNTVLAHATTHKTAWVSTGQKPWGKHCIETGYAARIRVHSTNTKVREYDEISYLPGLIFLQKEGFLTFYSSAELHNEQFYQPLGRFRGYGYFDYNLFMNVPLRSINRRMFPLGPREQLFLRLKKMEAEDPEYASLVAILGKKIAKTNGIYELQKSTAFSAFSRWISS